jgi:2OG-Fe(II) oxygenase superfamily
MIVAEKEFNLDQLRSLCNGVESVLLVRGYASQELCSSLAGKIREALTAQRDSNSAIYQTDTLPFFNAIENTEKYRTYFSNSRSYMRHFRELCSPFLGPTDKLRLELDEFWPFGAGVMDLQGQKMVFGIARIWNVGSEGLPHQDVLRRELPDTPKAKLVSRQFGVNIYLTTPTDGGEIEVWDKVIEDAEWKKMNVPGSYGFARSTLPKTSTLIKPQADDLVLIDTSHVHAIRPVLTNDRITISGFMAYFNDSRPLELWS